MHEATYTKLRSGAWGVRGAGNAPFAGDTVVVLKKSGARDERIVSRVVWSGPARDGAGNAWIAAVEDDGGARRGRSSYRARRSASRGICEDAPCCGCCGPQSDNQDHWYAGRYDYSDR